MDVIEKEYMIGIDTGTKTGIAVWSNNYQKFLLITTTAIHRALDMVKQYNDRAGAFVRVEDARKRKFYGSVGCDVLQGVGSVKRDASIWEDFLKDLNIDFECVHPIKGGTKLNENLFRQATKWDKKTDQHGRDAAMIVFQFKKTKQLK